MDEARIERLTRAIAGNGLPGAREPQRASMDGGEWPRLLSRVRAERITGLAVEGATAGWLAVTDEQVVALLAAHREAMTWCLLVEQKLLALADAFDADGIAFAVLKGASVAHTMYEEPCLRSFVDVDLLVSTADYERACALLGGLGHERQRPEPRPGFEVRFGKASVHKHPNDGIEVDLHRTLVLGPFGLWIDPDELLDRREPFRLAGRELNRLDDTAMLLNVAMHASLGARPPRLVPLRDLLLVGDARDVEWDTLDRWARAWRLTAVLRHAFATAAETLGAPVPAGAKHLVEATTARAERRALAAYTTGRRADGGTALATLRAVPGVRAKGAYVRALGYPDRTFLKERAGTEGGSSRLRRLSVPAGWVRRRLRSRITRTRTGA